jgi:transcriptional regulator with XRE-family HTH domain
MASSVVELLQQRRSLTYTVATGAQCRAARALLNWSQRRLAEEARVARKTVADFEAASRPLRERTRRDITETLQENGIEFTWDNGEGVRFLARSTLLAVGYVLGRIGDAALSFV